MHEVVKRLKINISQSNMTVYHQRNDIINQTPTENPTLSSVESSSHRELSQTIQNFRKMTTNEIEPTTSTSKQIINENILLEKDFSIMVNEIVDIIFKEYNKGIEWKVIKQHVLDYINNHNLNLQLYNWLLDNQNNSDSIFLLGYFNYFGIETSKNHENAFKLFINASEQN